MSRPRGLLAIPSFLSFSLFALLAALSQADAAPTQTGAPAPGTALSLRQAISEIEGSPQIAISHASAEEASWKRVEAYSGFLPQVSVGGSFLFDKKYALLDVTLPGAPTTVTIPQIVPTTTLGLNITWPIFDGLANVDRLRAAQAGERAGSSEDKWARFRAEREIILLFYRALGAQTLRSVAQQNVKTIEDHLNDAKVLKQAGVGTRYDVLRVEVQQTEARSELLGAEDSVAVGLQRLGEALGRPDENRVLQGELPVFKPELISSLEYGISERGDLNALHERATAADRIAGMASKHWVPRVALFGSFQEYNNRNDKIVDADAFRFAYNYGVQATWNIFDGLSASAKDHQAAQQRIQAEKSVEVAELRSRGDFDNWRRRYLYSCALYRARSSNVDKAEESVRLARESRRVGTRTTSDLLDAELDLFRSRAGVVNAQLGAIEALINLELATGRQLYTF